MDAVKFIQERDRMCDSANDCEDCPARDKPLMCKVSRKSGCPASEQVEIVDKWSNEHPRKTRQSVFLEQHPNARVDTKGKLDIWPCYVEKNMQNVIYCNSLSCKDCRREFWAQEVE